MDDVFVLFNNKRLSGVFRDANAAMAYQDKRIAIMQRPPLTWEKYSEGRIFIAFEEVVDYETGMLETRCYDVMRVPIQS